MQNSFSQQDAVAKLVFELAKLPGIGEKSATRLAYFILKQDPTYAQSLSSAIVGAKQKTVLCSRCFNFTDVETCRICSEGKRDSEILCVVERPSDVLAIERTQRYRGRYHVLHGVLSPLDGIGPEHLKIHELLERLKSESSLKEMILAMNPSVEGEATTLYLSRLLKPLGVKITRLAYGIPIGGMLEYTDQQTIGRAVENRVTVQ